jgi:hypothetical protein
MISSIFILRHRLQITFLFVLMMGSLQSDAQRAHISDGVIISCNSKRINTLVQKAKSLRNQSLSVEKLGEASSSYLLKNGDDFWLYDWCKSQPEVDMCEYNMLLNTRTIHNDPMIDSQYYLRHIKASDSWKVSDGGKQNSTEPVIMVVIDNGFDMTHEDLKDVFYLNQNEIPNDGIDNEGNGLIDDVSGWNISTNSSKHFLRAHGTNVLGVLAATHNNKKGIAGVHPNVRIYPISTIEVTSETIKAYEFILHQKKLYLESAGKKGLNFGVLNHSSGKDFAFAKDHPVWCGLYDKMGELGILSIVATSNDETDVERLGDMPSTCTSPYLIVVGSTNKKDEYYTSGFGTISVDLSAPGERILTTHPEFIQPYFYTAGTSMATPMVAGAVSFLYAIPCDSFSMFQKTNPSAASLAIKEIILTSTDIRSTLTSRTVSRGRLNMLKAVEAFQKKFNCNCHLSINKIKYIGDYFQLDYFSGYNHNLNLDIYDTAGKSVFSQSIRPIPGVHQSISLDDFIHKGQGIRFLKLSDDRCSATKGILVLK